MKCNYVLEYLNENEYRKKESAIKKYSMLAYKKLIFQIYSSLREGDFQGVIVSRDERYKSESYELPLPTDSMFNKLYGNITLHYTVYLEQMLIMLENITPEDIVLETTQNKYASYKRKTSEESDRFKINLLNILNKND